MSQQILSQNVLGQTLYTFSIYFYICGRKLKMAGEVEVDYKFSGLGNIPSLVHPVDNLRIHDGETSASVRIGSMYYTIETPVVQLYAVEQTNT